MIRIGHGYDVHRFASERKLFIGGVEIPCDMGLLGHSDADVLLHAVCDALLGAAALGDIGKHFPDSSELYEGIDSKILLKKTAEMLSEKGYEVVNIDCTVIAQYPKLAKFIPEMCKQIAQCVGTDVLNVNVKATTEEGLGFTGERLGIAAHSVCIIQTRE